MFIQKLSCKGLFHWKPAAVVSAKWHVLDYIIITNPHLITGCSETKRHCTTTRYSHQEVCVCHTAVLVRHRCLSGRTILVHGPTCQRAADNSNSQKKRQKKGDGKRELLSNGELFAGWDIQGACRVTWCVFLTYPSSPSRALFRTQRRTPSSLILGGGD